MEQALERAAMEATPLKAGPPAQFYRDRLAIEVAAVRVERERARERRWLMVEVGVSLAVARVLVP